MKTALVGYLFFEGCEIAYRGRRKPKTAFCILDTRKGSIIVSGMIFLIAGLCLIAL